MKTGGMPPLQKLARLKLELTEAVKKEAYEKAAKLRDRIQELQVQLTQPSKRPKIISQVARHLSDQ
jgi:protein-arginine kinase activator protein McsA